MASSWKIRGLKYIYSRVARFDRRDCVFRVSVAIESNLHPFVVLKYIQNGMHPTKGYNRVLMNRRTPNRTREQLGSNILAIELEHYAPPIKIGRKKKDYDDPE